MQVSWPIVTRDIFALGRHKRLCFFMLPHQAGLKWFFLSIFFDSPMSEWDVYSAKMSEPHVILFYFATMFSTFRAFLPCIFLHSLCSHKILGAIFSCLLFFHGFSFAVRLWLRPIHSYSVQRERQSWKYAPSQHKAAKRTSMNRLNRCDTSAKYMLRKIALRW